MQLPETAIISVLPSLAGDLITAANALPVYQNQQFYDEQLQLQVFNNIRHACIDGYDELIATIKQKLRHPPYCVVVKGLQFDDSHKLLVAINRALGRLVARPYDPSTPRAQLIHHIQPVTDKNTQSGRQKYSEYMHTDGADRIQPCRYLAMQCVRPDAMGGGRSLLLSIDDFRELILQQQDLELLHFVEQKTVPWQLSDYLGGGVCWSPILQATQLRWRRYTIEHALDDKSLHASENIKPYLDKLEYLVESVAEKTEFNLAAQDLMIIDNWRCLHARTALVDPDSDRLMLRLWIEED